MKKIIGIFICTMLIFTASSSASLILNEKNIYSPLHKNIIYKSDNMSVPDYFNWRDHEGQDWTTPAKNRIIPIDCGSCYIFAAVGIIESVIKIREGDSNLNPDLSEQYVLSCLPGSGNGCNGGFPYDVLESIIDNSNDGNYINGIITEACMPYQADDSIICESKCSDWIDYLIPLNSYGYFICDESPDSIIEIKNQIMNGGPVVSCILQNNQFIKWCFENHGSNDYYHYSFERGIDHDVIIVGWKDDPSIDNGGYWIVKDSYGDDFGYGGFFNIEYGMLGSKWIDDNVDTTYIVWVDYDPDSYEWKENYDSPKIVGIYGEINGNYGDEYEYTFIANDPNGLDLFYFIQWGDGYFESWVGPFSSNSEIKINHTWNNRGSFFITAMVKNTDNLCSQWSTLEINMPKNKSVNDINPWFGRLIERFPILELLL